MSATKPKPPSHAEPIVWGMLGAIGAMVLALLSVLAHEPVGMAAPAGGGFFTGWLAANLWNWSGRWKRRP